MHEMDIAMLDWCVARDNFHGEGTNGIEPAIDGYWEADRALLLAFSRDWKGSDAMLQVAYRNFRRSLIESRYCPEPEDAELELVIPCVAGEA
jgi:hypothetical protein